MTSWGMVIDLEKCIGCDACTVACKVENSSPGSIFYAPVLQTEVGKYPKSRRIFIPTLCMHCDDPPCMKSCAAKAIIKRKDGIVLVEEDRCVGSNACIPACPYGAMYFFDEKDVNLYPGTPTPFDELAKSKHRVRAAQKCMFCAHRVDYGLKNGLVPGVDREATPACVITCPAQCRIFGDLEDPKSKPSILLKQRRSTTLRPEAKTGPNVIFLLNDGSSGHSSKSENSH